MSKTNSQKFCRLAFDQKKTEDFKNYIRKTASHRLLWLHAIHLAAIILATAAFVLEERFAPAYLPADIAKFTHIISVVIVSLMIPTGLFNTMATWRTYLALTCLMDHRANTRFPDHPEMLIRDRIHIRLLQLIIHKPGVINTQLVAEPNKATRIHIAYRDADGVPHNFYAKAGQLNFAMQSVGITATEIQKGE